VVTASTKALSGIGRAITAGAHRCQCIKPRRQQLDAPPDDGETVNLQLYDKTGTDWLDLAVVHVFKHPRDRWICVDGILHVWNGTHYQAKPDDELAPQLAAFLSHDLCQ
jgi:hypothetical protein